MSTAVSNPACWSALAINTGGPAVSGEKIGVMNAARTFSASTLRDYLLHDPEIWALGNQARLLPTHGEAKPSAYSPAQPSIDSERKSSQTEIPPSFAKASLKGDPTRVWPVRSLALTGQAAQPAQPIIYPDFMRFLFLTGSFSLQPGSGHLIQQLAEDLVSRGHTADVLSMGIGQEHAGPADSETPGIRVFILGPAPFWAATRGPAKYLPNVWRLNLNRRLARWLDGPYDGFMHATPGVLSAGLGARLKRSGTVKQSGMFMWDFFPVANQEAGAVGLGRTARVAFSLERSVVKNTDVLFTMSPGGARYAKAYYRLTSPKTVVLPPWGSQVIPDTDQDARFDEFTFVWGGQFIGRRAIPDLLAAAQILERRGESVAIRLVGDGPLLDESKMRLEQSGLSSVRFEGRLSRMDYLKLLRRSHAAISVIEPGSSPSFPSKTVDYCQAGLPLVISVEEGNDYGDLIAGSGAGLAVTAGDVEGLADAMSEAVRLSSTSIWPEMCLASRRFFDERLDVKVASATVESAFAV